MQFCSAAGFRKMIPGAAAAAGERCLTDDHVHCPVFSGDRAGGECPHLERSTVQYCAAAAAPRYVPWSEHEFSRCGSSGHRYCDLYLSMARAGHPPRAEYAGDIPVPRRLSYTANHMWLDRGEDGAWHIGLDALLTRALGAIERITFVSASGLQCPVVVVRTGGREYPLVFPERLSIGACNLHLRADPERLTRSPYAYGWLFEGEDCPRIECLIPGDKAAAWMQTEHERMSRFAHDCVGAAQEPADGGAVAEGILPQLEADDAWGLFNAFFTPHREVRL